MFVKSTEIAYLNSKEYHNLVQTHTLVNIMLETANDAELEQLAANAVTALLALITSDSIQIKDEEEEE